MVRGSARVTSALQVIVTAPVVSFRDRLYDGVQTALPCPPPSTVGGFLASAVGGWQRMPPGTRFAMAFTAGGAGVDLETYHPLDARGTASASAPRERPFLADVALAIWLVSDLELWEAAIRRPVWPVRLGRSQDLASARADRVILETGTGIQRQAVVPADLTEAGTLLRLPTAISEDRSQTRWGEYRYASSGGNRMINGDYVTADGQTVAFLQPTHPSSLGPTAAQ
jgi:CRISPR-associated protein Cas5t